MEEGPRISLGKENDESIKKYEKEAEELAKKENSMNSGVQIEKEDVIRGDAELENQCIDIIKDLEEKIERGELRTLKPRNGINSFRNTIKQGVWVDNKEELIKYKKLLADLKNNVSTNETLEFKRHMAINNVYNRGVRIEEERKEKEEEEKMNRSKISILKDSIMNLFNKRK